VANNEAVAAASSRRSWPQPGLRRIRERGGNGPWAAIEVIEERGVHKVQIRDVAEQADTALGDGSKVLRSKEAALGRGCVSVVFGLLDRIQANKVMRVRLMRKRLRKILQSTVRVLQPGPIHPAR